MMMIVEFEFKSGWGKTRKVRRERQLYNFEEEKNNQTTSQQKKQDT